MSVVTSNPVSAGDDILAENYNDLRDDVLAVEASALPLGGIIMWAGADDALPTNCLLCDGSAISRTTYSTLFALLGTTFGAGDESTTFNLPNMVDKFVVGAGGTYSRADTGGSATVNSEHQHTVSNHTHTTPALYHSGGTHTHIVNSHTHPAGSLMAAVYTRFGRTYTLEVGGSFTATHSTNANSSQLNNYTPCTYTAVHGTSGASAPETGFSSAANDTHAAQSTSSSGGGNTSIAGSSTLENRPPYVGIYFIIKAL